MLNAGIQFFGGRGSGGGKRSGGAGGVSAAADRDPMNKIEAQVVATEDKINRLKQQQADLDNKLSGLIRDNNWNQIKANRNQSDKLAKDINALQRELNDLHRKGRALYRD